MIDSTTIVAFSREQPTAVDLQNFWPPEEAFVWSSGKWCEMAFEFAIDASRGDDRLELILDLDAFRNPPSLEAQNIHIYLNGLRIGSRRISKRTTALIEFNPDIVRRYNVLLIDTPDAVSPSAFAGQDSRVLGIQLFTFQLRYFTPPAASFIPRPAA